MTSNNLETIAGRLMFLETRKLEAPDSMTTQDWKDYRHLKKEYAVLQKRKEYVKAEPKVNMQTIRKYSDGIVWRGER